MRLKQAIYYILSKFVLHEDGDWKYLKIGKVFIGAYSATTSLTITSAVGSVYQTSSTQSISLPITLTSNLYTGVSVRTAMHLVWPSIYGSNGTLIQYRAVSPLSRTATDYNIKAFTFGII